MSAPHRIAEWLTKHEHVDPVYGWVIAITRVATLILLHFADSYSKT